MQMGEAVGKRVLELCRERNISVRHLCVMSSVSPSTIYRLLREPERDISIVTVKKLCDGAGIKLGDFFDSPDFPAKR